MECAEGGDEGGVAACADGDPGGGPGREDEGSESVAGTGTVDRGFEVERNKGEAAGGGGTVEGEESESEEKPRDQKADDGNETEALEDQAGEGKLD